MYTHLNVGRIAIRPYILGIIGNRELDYRYEMSDHR